MSALILIRLGLYAESIDMMAIPGSSAMASYKKYLNGASMEYVTFYTQHNERGLKAIVRSGILYKNPLARATILVCHGFMCNKFDVGFLRQILFPQFNVMMFDFRAHGENIEDDHCCTFGRDEAYDVLGAVAYIRSRKDIQHLPLIAYGFSMGAVAVIQAQGNFHAVRNEFNIPDKLFDAMILDCPYDTSENVLKRALENLKITILGYTFDLPGRSFLERYAFNSYVQSFLKMALRTVAHLDATQTNTYIYPVKPVDSIKNVNVPCFFIHCVHDEKVSVQAARNLYSSAAGYKRLWITQGRGHFDSFFYNPEKYVYKVQRFIDQLLFNQLKDKSIQEKIISDVKL
jgi:pimeloyl-ACP methyl ester carboxylesterase